jgi:hypothetical protein
MGDTWKMQSYLDTFFSLLLWQPVGGEMPCSKWLFSERHPGDSLWWKHRQWEYWQSWSQVSTACTCSLGPNLSCLK